VRSYLISLQSDRRKYLLKVEAANLATEPIAPYAPNSLAPQHELLVTLRTHKQIGAIPLAIPIAFDTSRTTIPNDYQLLELPSFAVDVACSPLDIARARATKRQNAMIDLKLGALLHVLHEVQNDWFGPPMMASDGIWSWQEAFTLMLEEVLSAIEAAGGLGLGLDISELRRLLSRAIGAFIFDDAEVPSLVWFMGGEEGVWVSIPEDGGEPQIAYMLDDLSFAMWGDPLLERLFVDPKPSQALLEGYQTPLILYPRQKTKRIWYTLYTAAVVLLSPAAEDARRQWALEAIKMAVEGLKNAPCY
jgi:hypothetical protein